MSNDILNLTQHKATLTQVENGVFDIKPELQELLKKLLTFTELPSSEKVRDRARAIAVMVENHYENTGIGNAMIGGAPFLMEPLAEALRNIGFTPIFAFSQRKSVEKQNPDGSVTKSMVFVHEGLVIASRPF